MPSADRRSAASEMGEGKEGGQVRIRFPYRTCPPIQSGTSGLVCLLRRNKWNAERRMNLSSTCLGPLIAQ
jgi:hypothetical protein